MSDQLDTVQACLALCVSGDSLVLVSTAVNLLLDQAWRQALAPGVMVYALAADAAAQGVSSGFDGCEFIDDPAWARLAMRQPHCLSWK